MVRFWNKVKKEESGCWNWIGALRSGYGIIKIDGKLISTHRLSYILTNGNIPEGMFICHKCDNPKCVNPDHLFLGTRSDNMIDALNKGRIYIPNGKEFLFKDGHKPKSRSLSNFKSKLIKYLIKEGYSNKYIQVYTNTKNQTIKDIRGKRAYS